MGVRQGDSLHRHRRRREPGVQALGAGRVGHGGDSLAEECAVVPGKEKFVRRRWRGTVKTREAQWEIHSRTGALE